MNDQEVGVAVAGRRGRERERNAHREVWRGGGRTWGGEGEERGWWGEGERERTGT